MQNISPNRSKSLLGRVTYRVREATDEVADGRGQLRQAGKPTQPVRNRSSQPVFEKQKVGEAPVGVGFDAVPFAKGLSVRHLSLPAQTRPSVALYRAMIASLSVSTEV